MRKCTPTLFPEANFDAKKDADILHAALADTKKPDHMAIRDILSKRVCKQRIDIENTYRESFKEVRIIRGLDVYDFVAH